MPAGRLLIFGLGYSAKRFLETLTGACATPAPVIAASDWHVDATGREARAGVVALDDPAVPDLIGRATYILSSTPPSEGADPVLSRYEKALSAGTAQLIYLSSTGVYGDAAGAWVDETAPTGEGRRQARSAADAGWQALGAAVLRLPGIYGPGRSPFARLRDGTATRIDAPGQVFSRIHVDDIAAAIAAVIATGATGIFNIADDRPAPAADVTAFAARLAGIDPPPLVPLAEADLSPMARGFYTENRRVANGKMKRDLGLALRYPDYRAGLRAVWEEEKRA